MEKGKIIRFDAVRGYGFIAPDHGGDDVFLHISAIQAEADRARPGAAVEFDAVDGDQGRKALTARVLYDTTSAWAPSPPRAVRPAATQPTDGGDLSDGDLCEVVSSTEFGREITDVLIAAAPSMTAAEIVQIRQRLTAYARARGWLED